MWMEKNLVESEDYKDKENSWQFNLYKESDCII